ncbi:hypothetical protein CLAFUW4_08867 [Fulvia fulva]|uniref:Glycosyltransferase 2-like domain-containing protein n=1 Tax=Passalora fulva TaxID=5499 RepID=A0A9Q8PGT2_PASFU|nr:uncharacterized protein CLAFUR5_08973 [Fulvia fulva]KAK4614109.1 hypothetical protein CLAFUR4_08873 [Fulvia fulva]KAK4615134.1 hypothetical protein CLAFUR0_08865 [Fulvia fulva]UJO22230.1 hypothetical protein CLAFUR5_08973 [Fulvia fulva]WPV20728.1 hypothetical protein CLAFUW4_08867 [Fulvia fulva]WPV34982.1 hypothetical protein CLAFUW7_08868 [Fulvia fulva]
MASMYAWTTRCIPAFSCMALGVLLVFSFIISPYGKGESGHHNGEATISQSILAFWTVFLHILSIIFPLRVIWSIRNVITKIRESAIDLPIGRGRGLPKVKSKEEKEVIPTPLFVIILPAYKEEMSTLEETLKVLASHDQAAESFHVYLAMEEKEEKSAFKAASLCRTFERAFYRMSYTVHPAGIPGEAQGKSSNEAWAAKQAMRDYPDDVQKRNTIFTVMDADTHLSSRYFTQVRRFHLENPDTNEICIYVPPLVFDRNLHHVPLMVRTADLMWAGAGISSLYGGSRIVIPTSVYSLPMTLVETVGGWDTGPGAIGEDMHMYLKCFFALSGNLKVHIVYAAASQCNVSSEAHGVYGYFLGLKARYKQALRHMWGSVDTGYTVRETVKMFGRHNNATKANASVPLSAPNSNWTAFYTSTGLHKSLGHNGDCDQPLPPKPVNWYNLYTLYHRIFEAHFLPIHLATILTCSEIYSFFYPKFLVPTILHHALQLSGFCRLIGFCSMLTYFYHYERYHRLCVGLRKEEMRRAGLLEEMEENDGFTPNVFLYIGLFEVATFPIGGFVMGAIPALQAVISHLFTDRLTYVVSLKPTKALAAVRSAPWKDMSRITP